MDVPTPKFCVFCGHNKYTVVYCGSSVWIECVCCLARGPKERGVKEAIDSWDCRQNLSAHHDK